MPTAESFNRFLARQPILTHERQLYAYEILSRYGPENYCRPKVGSPVSENAMDELFLMGIRTDYGHFREFQPLPGTSTDPDPRAPSLRVRNPFALWPGKLLPAKAGFAGI